MKLQKHWKKWLAERQKNKMMVIEVGIGSLLSQGWGLIKNRFRRDDGRFFQILGVWVKNAPREIKEWFQLLMQRENGIVIQVISPTTGHYLIQAKAEPGFFNIPFLKGCVALNATFVASEANMAQIHGGAKPPRYEIAQKAFDLGLLEDSLIIKERLFRDKKGLIIPAPEDGGTFDGKVNKVGILYLSEEDVGELLPEERWFTQDELFEAMLLGLIGYHLLQVLGVRHLCPKR